MAKPRVLVTTVPFGELDPRPLEILNAAGVETVINPLGRKLQEGELDTLIKGFDALVAGTETISSATFEHCPSLRLIARVGIGLDGVDLNAARQRGISVSYTPDGPSPAVSELTMGLIFDLLRGISKADRNMRNGIWHRTFGQRLALSTVGIIGVGRIGKLLARSLRGAFPDIRILANDLEPDRAFGQKFGLEWVEKERLYQEADVITLHVPLTGLTKDLICHDQIAQMKPSTVLVNTARGGIVNELDLLSALDRNVLAGAAIDTFAVEPYSGPLAKQENCLLTCHMASMSSDCRSTMEIEACEEVRRFFSGAPLATPVPEFEYEIRLA